MIEIIGRDSLASEGSQEDDTEDWEYANALGSDAHGLQRKKIYRKIGELCRGFSALWK